MKTNILIHHDPELEKYLNQKHFATKQLARKNATLAATRNLPNLVGDCLDSYIGDIKGAYEELGAFVHQRLQPDAHLPNVKRKNERAEDKASELDTEIGLRQNQNDDDGLQLEGFHPEHIVTRFKIAVITTLILCLGEIVFNAQAFQFTGENKLSALIIALSISVGVVLFSHLVPLAYKMANTKLKRRIVLFGSISLVIGVFIVLAYLRNIMYAHENIIIPPAFFVVINLFFFIVSGLLSFFILPSWQEYKEHRVHLELYNDIQRRDGEIAVLKKEKELIKDDVSEQTMDHIQAAIYCKHIDERIVRMCRESINIFISTNLRLRSDGGKPDCFNDVQFDADISYAETQSNYHNYKIK